MGAKKKKEPTKLLALWKQPLSRKLFFYALLPALLYFAFFDFYSWPWISHFSSNFFTDQGDGFQNIWDMWWVNFSVTHLHQLPWHTGYLHYPYGTTLIAQTLSPFNGFVGIGLMKFLTPVQAYNTMVVFSFVFGGISAFWLCHFFTKKYLPSLIGGFIFTFSSYHFAHAIGHMQLVSLEWIPLFILLWWKFLLRPRYRLAAGAALVLLLVLLCDYYYFLYSVAAAGLIAFYLWRKKELADLKTPAARRPLILFSVLTLILVAPLPAALLIENSRDPLQGSHPERIFSTDLFTPFLDGGFWRFAHFTHWYWKNIHAYVSESSIYLGISVWVLIVIGLVKRSRIHKHMNFWIVFGLIFAIFSMGPKLMVFGYSINHSIMPYALLEKLIPQLKLSGVPVRMMFMATLAAAIISAMVLAKLDLKRRKGQALMAVFFVILFFEMWPAALPNNPAYAYPAYVNKLKQLPAGAVFDNAAVSESWQLYDQTITDKPIALGYISRTPLSVQAADNLLVQDIAPGKYGLLCSQHKIRYFTTPVYRPLSGFPVLYDDGKNIIYDLKDSPNC